jgi:hypothetical protein
MKDTNKIRYREVPELQTGRSLGASGYYRRFLDTRFRKFTLAGLVTDDEPILLRQIYVPLVLTPRRVPDNVEESDIHRNGRELADWFGAADEVLRLATPMQGRELHDWFGSSETILNLSTATEVDRTGDEISHVGGGKIFFVAGEAGSGKTTLMSAVVTSLAGTTGDNFNRQFMGFLPFPILLRDAPIDRLESLEELVIWWLNEAKNAEPDLSTEDVIAFLDHGRGILMLDGLDELGTLERRLRVLRWLTGHRWLGPASTNLTVVTARPSGFEGLGRAKGVPTALRLYLAPLSFGQIRSFLGRWFALRPMPPARRTEQVEALIERLEREQRMSQLRMLARRPAYLASLAFVHGTRGALPHTRAALYDTLLDAYIDTLDRQRGVDRLRLQAGMRNWDRQEKREVLAAVAWQAHVGATRKRGERWDMDRRFSWSRLELENAVEFAINQGKARFRTIRSDDAKELTDYFIARTGLLVESREGSYQFGHLSFQEYLTALYALDRASGSDRKADAFENLLLQRLGTLGWEEVVLLALAVDSTRTHGTGHRAVLAKLDPSRTAHIQLIGTILAGEEVPLEPLERLAWMIAWTARAWPDSRMRGLSGRGDAFAAIAQELNRGAIELLWHVVTDSIASGPQGVLEAVRGIADTLVPKDKAVEFDNFEFVSTDPLDAPRQWIKATPEHGWSEFMHQILTAPLMGNFVPQHATENLINVIANVPLFEVPSESCAIAEPTPYWYRLNEWVSRRPELIPHLARRTPLVELCRDEFTLAPPILHLRWSNGELGDIELWRRRCWKDLCSVEVVLCAHLVAEASKKPLGHSERKALLKMVCKRQMSRSAWDDSSLRADANHGAIPRAGMRLHLVRQLAAAWANANSFQRARQNRRLTLKIVRELGLDETPVVEILRVWREAPSIAGNTWRRSARAAILAWLTAVALGEIGCDITNPIPRATVQAWRNRMADSHQIAKEYPQSMPHARAEWEALLRSPLSPLSWFQLMLSQEWDAVDVSHTKVTAYFNRAAMLLLNKVKDGGVANE